MKPNNKYKFKPVMSTHSRICVFSYIKNTNKNAQDLQTCQFYNYYLNLIQVFSFVQQTLNIHSNYGS